jgi:hypothetical protein
MFSLYICLTGIGSMSRHLHSSVPPLLLPLRNSTKILETAAWTMSRWLEAAATAAPRRLSMTTVEQAWSHPTRRDCQTSDALFIRDFAG